MNVLAVQDADRKAQTRWKSGSLEKKKELFERALLISWKGPRKQGSCMLSTQLNAVGAVVLLLIEALARCCYKLLQTDRAIA